MRTTYTNGDPIGLQHNGCDGCSPSSINGTLCHESGCPESWRDSKSECPECGMLYFPESARHSFCSESCYLDHNGLSPLGLDLDFDGDALEVTL